MVGAGRVSVETVELCAGHSLEHGWPSLRAVVRSQSGGGGSKERPDCASVSTCDTGSVEAMFSPRRRDTRGDVTQKMIQERVQECCLRSARAPPTRAMRVKQYPTYAMSLKQYSADKK
eukprot:2074547-Rhodomonas_salina.2